MLRDLLRPARRVLSRTVARRRLLDAERVFFDAHSPRHPCARRPLVLPADYFARPAVHEVLVAWFAGERPLDLDTLESEWRRNPGGSDVDATAFHRNVACFVAAARDPRALGVGRARRSPPSPGRRDERRWA